MVRPAQRSSLVDNPAWLTTAVADVYDILERQVPPEWMPKLSDATSKGGKFVAKMKEYGCGNYGCVIPTLDSSVVLKATTDTTETEFAAKLSQTLVVPVVVEYFMVVALAARWHGRRISLLWRESADDVGVEHFARVIKSRASAKRVVDAIDKQHRASSRVLLAIKTGVTSMDVLGSLFDAWVAELDQMAKIPPLHFVATGMKRVWLEQHIFLSDVHADNLGRCMRDGRLEWVITDPGNVIVVEV